MQWFPTYDPLLHYLLSAIYWIKTNKGGVAIAHARRWSTNYKYSEKWFLGVKKRLGTTNFLDISIRNLAKQQIMLECQQNDRTGYCTKTQRKKLNKWECFHRSMHKLKFEVFGPKGAPDTTLRGEHQRRKISKFAKVHEKFEGRGERKRSLEENTI